jgi:hypothetical protein
MFVLFAAVALLLSATPASAEDVWGGPPDGWWDRGDSGSTYQLWDFETSMTPAYPTEQDNSCGEGYADFDLTGWVWAPDWECPEDLDPSGTLDGWHCTSEPTGFVIITIPNTLDPDGIKWIFMQITSSKAPSSVTPVPPAGGTSGTWPTGLPQIQHPGPAPFGGSWYTYNYGFWIIPNPESETIIIEVPYCTVIDQIVIDTICTHIFSASESTAWGAIKALLR